MKYKDILKEFVNEHTKLSMKFSVSCKGVYAGDYDKALWKLIKKQLDSNTKRVRKEYEEEIEDLKFEMREIDERRDL